MEFSESSEGGPLRSRPIRAQQKFSRPIKIEHLGQVTQLTSQCSYLGMKNYVTPWDNEHRHLQEDPYSGGVVGRMRSGAQGFCPAQSREWDRRHMRRPPNYSPGPPHSYEHISAWTYCACANHEKQPQTSRFPRSP